MISKRSIIPSLEFAMDSGIRRTIHSVGEAFGNRPQPASRKRTDVTEVSFCNVTESWMSF